MRGFQGGLGPTPPVLPAALSPARGALPSGTASLASRASDGQAAQEARAWPLSHTRGNAPVEAGRRGAGPHLLGGLPVGPGHGAAHLLQVRPQQQLLREQQVAQPHQPPPRATASATEAQISTPPPPPHFLSPYSQGPRASHSPLPSGGCTSWSSLASAAPRATGRCSWGPGGWQRKGPW